MIEDIATEGHRKQSSSEELLIMAAENLKRSIELTVRQLQAKKVRSEMKLRWSRSLARHVQVLVIVAEALNKIGGASAFGLDLAFYLSARRVEGSQNFRFENLLLLFSRHR